jgi:arabinan endo-1,5-alpha-L-arabinosidase
MSLRLRLPCAILAAAAVAACSAPDDSPGPTTVGGAAGYAGSAPAGGGKAGGGKAGSGGGSGASPSAGAGGTGGTIGSEGGTMTSGGRAGAATSGATSGGATSGGSAGASGGQTSGGGGAGGSAGGDADDRCGIANSSTASPPQLLALKGNLGTHDPMVLGADGKFYLFSTGNDIGAKTSNDLMTWQAAPDVFSSSTRPAWLAQQVPGVSNLWAPDASFFGGAYHLYYSASTFGKNRSCIGHLSRSSLSSGSWKDRGSVICSNVSTTDDFNAIDPNAIVDTDGTPWLAFGSFWSGIKLIKLTLEGDRDGTSLEALASRPSAGGALEAPFLVRRCGYYYLFMSWDTCCKGADSTYNIRVGRAKTLHEGFVDRDGKALLQGGGTLVLKGGTRYRGPGHNAVLFTTDRAYNVYHAYDADNNGASVLRISELAWDADGWPISAGP